MTSEQEIAERFGKDVLESLRSGKTNPAQGRLVLEFIAALDPEKATGKKIPWSHSKPRAREEPQP